MEREELEEKIDELEEEYWKYWIVPYGKKQVIVNIEKKVFIELQVCDEDARLKEHMEWPVSSSSSIIWDTSEDNHIETTLRVIQDEEKKEEILRKVLEEHTGGEN